MDNLTVGLFSKALMDSINENIRKVVKDYAEYLEPAKDSMINSEAILALYKIKEIISDESLGENEKTETVREILNTYDLDLDSFEY